MKFSASITAALDKQHSYASMLVVRAKEKIANKCLLQKYFSVDVDLNIGAYVILFVHQIIGIVPNLAADQVHSIGAAGIGNGEAVLDFGIARTGQGSSFFHCVSHNFSIGSVKSFL